MSCFKTNLMIMAGVVALLGGCGDDPPVMNNDTADTTGATGGTMATTTAVGLEDDNSFGADGLAAGEGDVERLGAGVGDTTFPPHPATTIPTSRVAARPRGLTRGRGA